jgi:hypothetical protein
MTVLREFEVGVATALSHDPHSGNALTRSSYKVWAAAWDWAGAWRWRVTWSWRTKRRPLRLRSARWEPFPTAEFGLVW